MKSRVMALFVSVIIMFNLYGCQLAVNDVKNSNDEPDLVVGVYVTLYNWGRELNKDISYGTVKEVEENGIRHYDVVFEEVEGISLFAVSLEDMQTGEPYDRFMIGRGLSEANLKVEVGEETKTNIMDGKIYIQDDRDIVVYVHPVYQKKDGTIYMVCERVGNANSFATSKMSGEAVGEVNNKNVKVKYSLEIESISAVEEARIIYMNPDNEVIQSQKYDGADEIKLPQGTEYIIVEHYLKDNPEEVAMRQLYDKDDKDIEVLQYWKNGIIEKKGVAIK